MTRLEKRLLWGSTAVVAATGFVYMWMKYALTPAQPWDAVNHPLQPLVLKLHILSAPVMVFAIGMIATRHIWTHYREQVARGRRSGITAAVVIVPMVLTGYLIQAVTHTGWLAAIAYAHIGFSVVFSAGLALHGLATRRVLRRRRAAAPGTKAARDGTATLATPGTPALNSSAIPTSHFQPPRAHAHGTGQAAASRPRRPRPAGRGGRGRPAGA